jgi:hypothetical protein
MLYVQPAFNEEKLEGLKKILNKLACEKMLGTGVPNRSSASLILDISTVFS